MTAAHPHLVLATRERLAERYRAVGPEAAPEAFLPLALQVAAGTMAGPYVDAIVEALVRDGVVTDVVRWHLTVAFRWNTLLDEPRNWVTDLIPGADAASWQWVARRKQLAELAMYGATTDRTDVALTYAAQAACADPFVAECVVEQLSDAPVPDAIRILATAANPARPPLTYTQAVTLVTGVLTCVR